jgi:hypothetical protein
MSYDPHSFVVRRPRHVATNDSRNRFWIEDLTSSLKHDVQLVDFSRNGAKLELATPITPDSAVNLCLQSADKKLSVSLPGHVRWQRRLAEGHWLLGCLFENEVSYEVIGELFLSGVLEMDSPSQ